MNISKWIIRDNSEYYKKQYENNALLYPGEDLEKITRTYFDNKCKRVIGIILVGILLFAINKLVNSRSESYTRLKRNAPEKDSYEMTFDVGVEGEDTLKVKVKVSEEKYSYEEFIELMPKVCEEIDREILGKNSSLDHISNDLNLVKKLDKYPFNIKWDISDTNVINENGVIWEFGNEEDGRIVNLSAAIVYGEYKYIYDFGAVVYKRDISKEEELRQKIESAISVNDMATSEEEYLELPSDIDGNVIVWNKKENDTSVIFIALAVIAAIGLFIGQDKDIEKKLTTRNVEMMEDYPEVVSKLAMLIGAGMTVRGAFKKIAMDGPHNRYAYEEMRYVVHEMESGNIESVCYKHFCQRVKLQKYVKLISLLEQNSRMGSRGLIQDLRNECKDAFEDKKNNAERKGEEAGTKLLVPMFMQLFIVMVVIMVPAFMGM